MDRELRILLVEDSAEDAEVVKYELENGGIDFVSRRVETKEALVASIAEFNPDLILSDYELPSFDGVSALSVALEESPHIPFIFVSGVMGEDFAVDMMKCGATDYVLKQRLSRLVPAVRRALEEAEVRRARRSAELELERSLLTIRRVLDQTVRALASVTETRDPYTAGHQEGVARLAKAIATELALPADMVEGIHVAAALHDIGKTAIPAEILTKPSRLTEIEFKLVKSHSEVGYEILKEIDFPWPVAKAVEGHHERLDGTGYPHRLSGSDITTEARVIAVADVVEAMASHRPYRPAHKLEVALGEIDQGKGRVYDSRVVEACLSLFREKGYRLKEH